jgi:very-short-patch-repair endonuclease
MSSIKYKQLSDSAKKDILNKYYVLEKLSFQDIALKYNTYANQIRRDAKKFEIPIRDKSQAQKNALSSGKHKHPTKGSERSIETKEKIGMGVMDSWNNLSKDELDQRKEKSRANWNNLSTEEKANIVKSANTAARLSSKTGSKLEKFLLEKLLADGYVVEFHKEQMLSNTKLQVDLFLPTMNLAIEVDGPSHFSPIWGEETFKKNQKYDEKKNGLLIGKGLGLIRIKQQKDFSTARANLIYSRLIDCLKNNKYSSGTLLEIEDE